MERGGRMNLPELLIALIIIFIAASMVMYTTITYVTQLKRFKVLEEKVLKDFNVVNYAYDYLNALLNDSSTPDVDFASITYEGSLIVISDPENETRIRIIKW